MEFAWVSPSGRTALGISDSGLGFFDGEKAEVIQWSAVTALLFPGKDRLQLVKGESKERVEFLFASRKDCDEFFSSVPTRERERLHLTTARPVIGPPGVPPSLRAAPAERSVLAPRSEAKGTLWSVFWGGAVLQVVGGFALGLSWPSVEIDYATGEASSSGSDAWLALGWSLIGAGGFLTLVAVIGFGTLLGIRAASEERALTL